MNFLILDKGLVKALGLEPACLYAYLLEKKAEVKAGFDQFFSVNLSQIEKKLRIKRRKKELALDLLCKESFIKIMHKKLKFSKDVRISINATNPRCNRLQDNALSGCNRLQDNALKLGQRNTASIVPFNIINYINIKKSVGKNSNSSVRKSILKFLEKPSRTNSGTAKNKATSSELQKGPKMNPKTKTNTKLSTGLLKDQMDKIKAEEIIKYLNEKTNKNFIINAKSNLKFINARLKEGNYKIEDFKKVIDLKVKEWSSWSLGHKFLRPQTLFSEKFDSYLNETEEKTLDEDLENFFEKNNCTPV